MNVDVKTEIEIDRPKAQVADFAANPDNAPAWYVNIKSVEWQTPRPAQVGARIAFVAYFLGRKMAYTYEIVEWVPAERLVMRTAEGPFPMQTEYTWATSKGGGTRMTLRNWGTPSGFSGLAAPFMAWAMRRANQKDLALLKQMVEIRTRDSADASVQT